MKKPNSRKTNVWASPIAMIGCVVALAVSANGQILLSGGLTYSQNFDGLSNAPTGADDTWTDNTTLPGWYASRAYTNGISSTLGPYAYTSYRVGNGMGNNGLLWSFGINGVNPVTDRALGSICSGIPGINVFGVRVQNDTGNIVGAVTITYNGKE